METGPRFIGSSDRLMRLEKPGIELDQTAVRFSHDAANIIFKQSIGLKCDFRTFNCAKSAFQIFMLQSKLC